MIEVVVKVVEGLHVVVRLVVVLVLVVELLLAVDKEDRLVGTTLGVGGRRGGGALEDK